jgi:hypothetical protein
MAIDGLSGSGSGAGSAEVAGRGCGGVDADAMGVHWPGDVLDLLLLAHVLEREGELVAYLVAHHGADADATGLRQGFESSGDADAVAEDVAPIDDDVAKIDVDAELDALCGRHLGIALAIRAERRPRSARRRRRWRTRLTARRPWF